MGFFRQLRYLLWKNFLIRRRQKVWLAVELIWPLILFLILAWVRTKDLLEGVSSCYYGSKALPSAGFLPFVQSLTCGLPNQCFNDSKGDFDIGYAQGFNGSSFLSDTVSFLERLAQPEKFQQVLDNFVRLVDDVDELKPYNKTLSGASTAVKSIFLRPDEASADFRSCGSSAEATGVLFKSSFSPLFPFVLLIHAQNWRDLDSVRAATSGGGESPEESRRRIEEELRQELGSDGGQLRPQLLNFAQSLVCHERLLNESLVDLSESELVMLREGMCNRTDFGCLQSKLARPGVFDSTKLSEMANKGLAYSTGLRLSLARAVVLGMDFQMLSGAFSDEDDGPPLPRPAFPAAFSNPNGSANSTDSLFTYISCGLNPDMYVRELFRSGTFLESVNDRGKKMRQDSIFANGTEKMVDPEDMVNNGTDNVICGINITNTESLQSCRMLQKSLPGVIPRLVKQNLMSLFHGFVVVAPFGHPAVLNVSRRLEDWFLAYEPAKDFLVRIMDNRKGVWGELERSKVGRSFFKVLKALRRMSETLGPLLEGLPSDNVLKGQLERLWETGAQLEESFNSSDPKSHPFLRPLDTGERFGYHLLSCFSGRERFIAVESETAMEKLAMCLQEEHLFYAGLVFDIPPESPERLPPATVYKIRLNAQLADATTAVMDRMWSQTARDRPIFDQKYLTYGFTYIQDMVDRAIIAEHTGVETVSTAVYAQQFPNPCYTNDVFNVMVQRMIPLFMTLSWVFSASLIVKNVVYEKERRLKEVMRVMGLGELVHWVAWFLTSLCVLLVSVVGLVLVLHLGRILPRADPTLLLFFLALYAAATISQAFLLSTLFSKANLAAASGAVLYFVLYLPYGAMVPMAQFLPFKVKLGSCAISQIAFGWGCTLLGYWESEQSGAQWSKLWESPIFLERLVFGHIFLALAADIIVHLLLTWYIEAVFPGEYGMPLPWYFPFTKSYWCGHSLGSRAELSLRNPDESQPSAVIEPEASGTERGVEVCQLRKVYGNGKLAVDELSVVFLRNQITSFLGHNGAGKTTTLSILTGLFPPSSGTVLVNGRDIRSDFVEIRKSLGMCPQHNVLYDILTVEEQLEFYAGLKGVSPKTLRSEVDSMIDDIGMQDKRSTFARDLSGGMQRKLSIAMAFVGGSSTVVLDEPTAGCDPHARRSIWDLLLKQKAGRTIILSTHHMDEADLLGDRIAIIAAGRLKAQGSSIFLKKVFGSGFSLTISRRLQHPADVDLLEGSVAVKRHLPPLASPSTQRATEEDDRTQANGKAALPAIRGTGAVLSGLAMAGEAAPTPSTQAAEISALVLGAFPSGALMEEVGEELRFSLGAQAAPGALAAFFARLETQPELPIAAYGVSDTTLEQIFLKIAGCDDDQKFIQSGCWKCAELRSRLGSLLKRKNRPSSETIGLAESDEDGEEESRLGRDHPGLHRTRNHSAAWLARRRLGALLTKRWHNFRRNPKGAVAEIVLPVGMVMLSLIWARLIPSAPINQPPLLLSPWLLQKDNGANYVFWSTQSPNSSINAESSSELEGLLRPPGIGTRCMNDNPIRDPEFIYCCDDVQSKWAPPPQSLPPDNRSIGEYCHCREEKEKGRYWDCVGEYEPALPALQLNTTDTLLNVTGHNITQWLLRTEKEYRHKRYGGVSLGDAVSFAAAAPPSLLGELQWKLSSVQASTLNASALLGLNWTFLPPLPAIDENVTLEEQLAALLSGLGIRNSIKVWYNNRGWPALASYVNVVSNARLRAQLPPGADPAAFGIFTYQHPMNTTTAAIDLTGSPGSESRRQLLEIVLLSLAFSIVPASFVLFLIEERITHAKHLQIVSGLSPLLYWLANFAWDMINFSIPVVLCYVIFAIFDEQSLIYNFSHGTSSFFLFMSYGFSTVLMMYPFVFVFRIPSLAFICLGIGNFFLGVVSTVVIFVLDELQNQDEDLKLVYDICSKVFLVLPQYCFGHGITVLKVDYFTQKYKDALGIEGDTPDAWEQVYDLIMYMLLQGVIAFSIIMLIEYYPVLCRSRNPKTPEPKTPEELAELEEDVAAERRRVLGSNSDDAPLRIEQLTKVYSSKRTCRGGGFKALDQLCLQVRPGECFGLLGVNGAGKTTTFKMLTGKTAITEGDAFFFGASVQRDRSRVQQLVGYCPQFDALNGRLTGREQLRFYAQLRGIPDSEMGKVVEWGVSHMQLGPYADHPCGNYSGGNKRKLSTAIALVGRPRVVLLDEPTTGMDPGARRFTWSRIAEVTRSGRSVVLTSHSMEECEALCSRIGIMVDGQLACIGTVQHLKSKFGRGYSLTLKMGDPAAVPRAQEWVKDHFPAADLTDAHGPMLHYHLPTRDCKLSHVFETISRAQNELDLEDYSLCQTSLDQVFLHFASSHYDRVREEGKAASNPRTDVEPVLI